MLMMGSPKFLSKLAGLNDDWLADQALWLLEFNVTGQSERWERQHERPDQATWYQYHER